MSAVITYPRMSFSPAGRGTTWVTSAGVSVGVSRLPTDPVGTFILTLTNVVVGSTLRIESQSAGTELYAGSAATSSPVIILSCYAGGSSNDLNNLRIKVRKGTTAAFYQPWETLETAIVGSRSIYVAQIPD